MYHHYSYLTEASLIDLSHPENTQSRAPALWTAPPAWPVWVLLVLDVQVFQGGDEGLSLEASGCPGYHWGVADSTVCSNGNNVAP